MLLNEAAVRAWYAAPDYVTITRHHDAITRSVYERYLRAAELVANRDVVTSVEVRPWAWQGYYGQQIGKVSVGRREDGIILRASGWAAEEIRGMQLPYDNVSRCDIALTVWLSDYDAEVARRAARLSEVARLGTVGRRWKITEVHGHGHGDTTYLGSRTSDTYVRVYDKMQESGADEAWLYAWRMEVEYKAEAAKEVWEAEGSRVPTADWWAAVVCGALQRRGLAMPRLYSLDVLPSPPRPREATTAERRLAWLRNQVAPAIEKLAAAGVSALEIHEALGLTNERRHANLEVREEDGTGDR